MKIKNILLLSFVMLFAFSSCMKKDNFDPEQQAIQDEAAIVKFLADNNITAVRHPSGVYYQVIQPGSGNIIYTANTTVTANYTGRLFSGSVFDKTTTQPIAFQLGGVIR